ncbi:conjugal transfer protein [Streptomyces sp. NPDC057235]|uniref:conjugal transfer protein n=1 Tax=Streptomyces sp. NPDC057235 TaxID=3346058 RepID=UPI003639702E
MTTPQKLTRGQAVVLGAATLPMIAVGGAGAVATFTNIGAEFGRAETALGAVAAGEGLTLVLALVLVGLTMLGQTAPAAVRASLWLAPLGAAIIGLAVADDPTEAVVYAITPMGMSGAAEGLGLVARRIVIYRTQADAETARRNADAARALAYHQARARSHPGRFAKWSSERATWRIARRIGAGDAALSTELLDMQRTRITAGAELALGTMMGVPASAPAPEPKAPAPPNRHSAREVLRRRFAEMEPAEAIRIVGDAHPDAAPAELASLLVEHGVVVDAVDVILVLGRAPSSITVARDDAPDTTDDADDAPQVSRPRALPKSKAILDAAAALGSSPKAADIVARVQRIHRITVDEPYVRTVLSRAKKPKTTPTPTEPRPMEGGYN